MPIPFVLCRGYTDDGCSKYECLQCNDTWEGRSGGFNFCPFCGIKFQGIQPNRGEERRDRFYQYKRDREWASGERPKLDIPPFLWVIEIRRGWSDSPKMGRWETERSYDGRVDPKEVLEAKREIEAIERGNDEHWNSCCDACESGSRRLFEVRIVKGKADETGHCSGRYWRSYHNRPLYRGAG